jgi:hypothetical protein
LGTDPLTATAEAYLVPLDEWESLLHDQGFDLRNGVIPGQPFAPKDAEKFERGVQQFRVNDGSPPVTTHTIPHHKIYLVKVNGKYFFNDITPKVGDPNDFKVMVK